MQNIDTVELAKQTPNQIQPFAELGLKPDEYEKIKQILGRRPTSAELAMYAVMWSEHCSYKSSKKYLKYFGQNTTAEMRKNILAGIGENAGVVDIGSGYAVTFKVESHNHPSYIEPYQGAATGVGGIVRDILAMGARPVAVMDQLFFGDLTQNETKLITAGVVSGIGGYGNSLGLANIGGLTVFDKSYQANPLVNALSVGVMRKEKLKLAFATGVGNRVILYGALTGRDGIGGVSVLASDTFVTDELSARRKKLPSVQVGDPFMEKILIECTLELYDKDLVVGIQDLGGAGLSCATSELAAAGNSGMEIYLDKVPTRALNMLPEEILSSESQERMCAIVAPEQVDDFMKICAKWDIPATDIGCVTAGDNLVITWKDQIIVEVPPKTVALEGPVYDRPVKEPSYQKNLNQDTTDKLFKPSSNSELEATLYDLLTSTDLCSRNYIVNQYDRYVRGNTVQSLGADAGVIRIDEQSGIGVAVAADASGRYAYLDPYLGTQLVLAESYRNVAVTGARPVAVTNCLNFGSPEDPEVMWQFQKAVKGLSEGCKVLQIPVTGGNVSFYNQTGSTAIFPTPVIAVLGVLEDVKATITPIYGTEPGEVLFLLGETRPEFDGSVWAKIAANHLGGIPPKVDLLQEKQLADILFAGYSDGLISAAHDLSEGGLAIAVVEMALASEMGCRITLPPAMDSFTYLFSESSGRVLVAVPRSEQIRFEALCNSRAFPYTRIGVVVNDSKQIEFQDLFTVSLNKLRKLTESVLPKLLTEA